MITKSGGDCYLVISLQDDEKMLKDIQKFYNTVIEELPADIADLV